MSLKAPALLPNICFSDFRCTSASVLSLHLPLTPSSSQHLRSASWAHRLVKLQTSREDSKDNFSHMGVWRCQCLSVSMSLAFITASLFPGTSHLVPSARCWGQLFSPWVRARIRLLLFTLVAHFSSFLPASFLGSSPFWPVFTPLCLVQQLSTSCCCYLLASCVSTGKNSVTKRGKDEFRFLGRGLKSMSVGMILNSFGADQA